MKDTVKVLVVDDSRFVTSVVSKRLASDPEIEVVGVAHDGVEALSRIEKLKPDVVTLDIIMPRMDGLEALKQIMSAFPTPVVMLSALTGEGAQATLEALELGAVDFFLKPSVVHPAGHDQSSDDLIVKVKQASRTKIAAKRAKAQASESTPEKSSCSESDDFEINRVLAIGSSTGGPKALMQVIPYLPADFPAAVLIVQHMPPVFTKAMAERLDKASKLEVREAVEGDRARHRLVLIAPGNYHMTLDRNGKIRLNQDPPRWGVRPSVDAMMESVAKYYGEVTLGVVLTGMGVDGTLGAAAIKGRGGTVFAQDEQTSAVYGMPMSVAKEGYADKILPLQKMADEIVKYCRSEVKVHA